MPESPTNVKIKHVRPDGGIWLGPKITDAAMLKAEDEITVTIVVGKIVIEGHAPDESDK